MRGWSGWRLALLLRTEGGLTPSIERLRGVGGQKAKTNAWRPTKDHHLA